MPIDQPNSQYELFKPLWDKCRTVMAGEDALKFAGPSYLPKLGDQSSKEYADYKTRAMLYNASGRTVQALTGALFRKQPVISGIDIEELNAFVPDQTDFLGFVKDLSSDILAVGRSGVLVDIDNDEDGNPVMSSYRAEDIINWSFGENSYIVLREYASVINDGDVFEQEAEERYRVLWLTDGVYSQELYRKTEDDSIEKISDFTPTVKGRPLEFIPFVFFNVKNLYPQPEEPPLLDLVNVNLSHYRNSADYEHGLHFTGLPTPWIAGFNSDDQEFKIGSGTAWVSSDPGATAGFLEFTGQGLNALKDAMEEKKRDMAILGARMLEGQKAAAEAAETLKLRNAGEASVLSNIAFTIDNGITFLIRVCAEWKGGLGKTEDMKIELNKDYTAVHVDAPLYTGLLASLQTGAISFDTWFYNLQKWEMVKPGATQADEEGKIDLGSKG